MSYRTVEVELEDGHVRPSGSDTLPRRGHGLLTLIENGEAAPARSCGELAEWWKNREQLSADEGKAFAGDIEEGRAKLRR